MISKLKFLYNKIYIQNKFTPSFLGIFTNPSYLIRKRLYTEIVKNKKYLKGVLLDFGCGSKPYKQLFDVDKYIGVDIEESGHDNTNDNIDIYYDGKKIPFKDYYFDSIFSTEVLEHVFNIDDIIKELYRVLKIDGYILVTVPFVWNEHEVPYDYARYTSYGLKHLFEKSGFTIVKAIKTTTFIETIFQMFCIYTSETLLPKKVSFKRAILVILFITPITVLGILISKVFPKNESFYNNNIIIAQKK